MKMKPSALLRTFSSFRFPARLSPSTVAPFPLRSSFDEWLSSELHSLRCGSYATANWVLNALDVALSTQTMTIKSLATVVCGEQDRKVIEDYVEDVVDLLDACNRLRERMETLNNYIESLRVVLHCFQGRSEPNESVLKRARVLLESCESMEKRCADLDKCSSNLRKLAEKLPFFTQGHPSSSTASTDTELNEVLRGSKAIALLVCGILGIGLSYKSKRGLPAIQTQQETYTWSACLTELHKEVKEQMEKQRKWAGDAGLTELRQTIVAARNLRDLMKNKTYQQTELRVNVEALNRRCGELEMGIKPFQGRVDELYKHLICIRMALLDILSRL